MSNAIKFVDLKYEDKMQTIEAVLQTTELPIIAKISNIGELIQHSEIPRNKEVLFQNRSEKTFAHIKVLKYYDNEKKEEKHGAEYVLEHETFVGNEYLMPLTSDKQVKYVRRPEGRVKYQTIKQVINDCPVFVRVENDTESHESSNEKQAVTIPAKTVLEVEKVYQDKTQDLRLICNDGHSTYTFSVHEKVNFSLVEKDKRYSLEELSQTKLLPKVILFQDASPSDVAIGDNELRSAVATIIDGPIEVNGFVNVEYITCWVRNSKLKSYETMLLPKNMWSTTSIHMRCFPEDNDKDNHISQMYGPCLKSNFIRKSLFVFPLNPSEPMWLRSPEFFKHHLEGNVFYKVIEVPYKSSSDEEDNIYSEIEELRPPLPKRDRNGTPTASLNNKGTKSELKKNDRNGENKMERSSSQYLTTDKILESEPRSVSRDKTDRFDSVRELKSEMLLSSNKKLSSHADPQYTLLEPAKAERFYDKIVIHSDTVQKLVPLGYSEHPVDKTEQYVKLGQVRKVLNDNQTQEDFFNYSVKEVAFCFEHCGLKNLADICYKKKLDGSFFKGFDDWKVLDLSSLDVIILKKVIYEGWRSKDDSEYVDTQL